LFKLHKIDYGYGAGVRAIGRDAVAESDRKTLLEANLSSLQERIGELEALRVGELVDYDRQVKPVERSIDDTLRDVFERSDADYRRYRDAAMLFKKPMFYTRGYFRETLGKSVVRSLTLLRSAKKEIQQRLDATKQTTQTSVPTHVGKVTREPWRAPASIPSVFIAHGHHEESRIAVVRFLEKIGFEAIVLHEQANQGLTIIEKIEAHSNVNFAIVLLTPDDFGAQQGGQAQSRARQNVILELGYFIGRLGRERVCAFKAGDIELPSDVFGVAWGAYDESKRWQHTLAKELEAAGYVIDWKRVALS
jgi:predicted nucleotide-binding protein